MSPPCAEATVAEACANANTTDSFDITSEVGAGGSGSAILEARLSGKKIHYTTRFKRNGEISDWRGESIHDGAGTGYYRDSLNPEWKSHDAIEGQHPFPYSRESICPDLTDAGIAFIGDDTVNGAAARKYSLDTEAFDWLFWIDSDGWLIQVERTELGASGASSPADGVAISATLSGRGEHNEIEIPTDAVRADSPRDISR